MGYVLPNAFRNTLRSILNPFLLLCADILIAAPGTLRYAGPPPATSRPVATQQQLQLPVLTNRPQNPVLLLTIKTGQALELDQLEFSTAGTSHFKDLKKISVYYDRENDPRKEFPEENLFGSTTRIGKKVIVSGSRKLPPGTHFFWVSLELDPATSLDHRIAIAARRLHLAGGTLEMPAIENPIRQRIGVAVRKHGQDNVHTSRIPGLATTNNGTLLAIFDARYDSARDLQGDIDIGLHRSTDGGANWEPIRITLDKGEWGGLPEKFNGVSDACILVDRNSDAIYIAGLWMHGVINKEGKWLENLDQNSDAWNHQWRNKASQPGFDVRQSSQFLIVKSTDDGKTWGEPVNLTRAIKKKEWWLLAPAPGAGITLKDGTLVFPTQGRDASGKGFSNITYSKDGGTTWKTSKPATMAVQVSTTECAVVQLSDGSLMLNMRSGRNKGNTGADNGRPIAVSKDMGETWQEHPTSFGALPEPTCMASLYMHHFTRDGQKRSLLVFSNPDSKRYREHITLKASADDGNTWPVENQVLLDEWQGRGYSCLSRVGDDHIGILYESSQADMVFQRIRIDALLNR